MSAKKKIETVSNNINFYNDEYYINRELSWLQFNSRCLSEAKDKATPLFEKLKFLSITASNLDEFFMVRVASLKDMINAGYKKPDIAGMSPKEQLDKVTEAVHEFQNEQYRVYNHMLLQELADNGIQIVREYDKLNSEEADYIDRYFDDFVYPVLTPMAYDSSRPFPLIRNKTLNIGALVKGKESNEMEFAMVQVPSVLPRIMEIPEVSGVRKIMLLEQIIQRNIRKLFLNYDIVCCYPFRVGRNADLSIDEDEAEDLLKEIEKQLKRRQWGQAIRLEIEKGFDKRLLKILTDELKVEQREIYTIDGPLDLTFLMKMYGIEGFDYLKEHGYNSPAPVIQLPSDRDIFECIREGDILMHHPYESFDPVVRFVEAAASDPAVLAIKQTLYRVSGNSPIIAALAKAADNGKQVSVLVELKARFDEENNIVWAKMLEKAGCHVIYGLKGLKTHSKITLVVRKEEDGIRRYVHLATGNYNDSTAKLYTDVGMFTCAEAYGEDATAVFNMLSGYSEPAVWNKLTLAPLWLKDRVLDLIKREADHARNGEPAHIIAKMNSICHKDVIAALYEASSAGVKIDLIVRGICCLKTGIPGVSENINVRSIVGNFLEHSRIFYFENGGSPEYYASSADWMPRNLERRVEIMFPVENPGLREKLWHILDTELHDNVKAHIMNKEGQYVKVAKRGDLINSQKIFGREATELSKPKNIAESRVFEPEYRDDHGL
ncbi:RNA degradosome polyphosphate kinase [Butyrivibrio sp. WCE2006]|uniref:RNA degradosome polyphosphate kinase n=1 Tax=Butyrivibrio sp. WCE2006 TaxID=1410611 RepID=UPI0005D24A1F|nr:RNA degradosome polyphosphate kinase [Butyrivibrio sp. WCE2006]